MTILAISVFALWTILGWSYGTWCACMVETSPTRRMELTLANAMSEQDIEKRIEEIKKRRKFPLGPLMTTTFVITVGIGWTVAGMIWGDFPEGVPNPSPIFIGWALGLAILPMAHTMIFWAAIRACDEKRALTTGPLPFVVGGTLCLTVVVYTGLVLLAWLIWMVAQALINYKLLLILVLILLGKGFVILSMVVVALPALIAQKQFFERLRWSEE